VSHMLELLTLITLLQVVEIKYIALQLYLSVPPPVLLVLSELKTRSRSKSCSQLVPNKFPKKCDGFFCVVCVVPVGGVSDAVV
jgi:hypothetical protein